MIAVPNEPLSTTTTTASPAPNTGSRLSRQSPPSGQASNRPSPSATSEDEVLVWLVHEANRRAAHAMGLASALPPQPISRELELSRLYVGLADLVQRLASAHALLGSLAEPALLDVVTDLQARTWVAASLLEARARLASGTESDPAYWRASADSLAGAYGEQLFA